MMRQFFIELRVSFDNDAKEKEEMLRKTVKKVGRELLTVAQLVSDTRKPQVSIHSTDMFAGNEEIALMDEEEENGVSPLEA